MDDDQNPTQAEPSRRLVAADEGIDPHRLVRLCCERAAPALLGVSLLGPDDDEPAAWAESAAPGRLVRRAAALLDAAGVRLEDVIVADEDGHDVDHPVRFGGFDALLVLRIAREGALSRAVARGPAGAPARPDGSRQWPPRCPPRRLAEAAGGPAGALATPGLASRTSRHT